MGTPAWCGASSTAAAGSEAAEAHFAAALEQSEKLPHLPERAPHRLFAQMRRSTATPRGDRERALALLAEAAEAYRGMPRLVEAMTAPT